MPRRPVSRERESRLDQIRHPKNSELSLPPSASEIVYIELREAAQVLSTQYVSARLAPPPPLLSSRLLLAVFCY